MSHPADVMHPLAESPAREAGYRPDIDGLRAVAITLVVAYHAFPGRFSGGFVGVDVFFVISGFLITGIIFDQMRRGTFTIASFYGRRVRRIFPAMITVVLATCLAGGVFLPAKEFQSLGLSMIGSAAFVQNFVLLGEIGYFDVEAARKPLLHLWSLAIEEQYYILWPLLLLLIRRLRMNPVTWVAVLAGISFWVGLVLLGKNRDLAFYLPISRFWELFAGSFLGIATILAKEVPLFERTLAKADDFLHPLVFSAGVPAGRNLPAQIGALLAVGLVAWVTFRLGPDTPFPGKNAALPIAAAMLLILCKRSWVNQRLLASPPMVFIGLISYPLYLWHFPLMAFARIMSPPEHLRPVMVGVVLLSVALAWLTYRFVEYPIRFGGVCRRAISALGAGMVVIGLLGLIADRTGGLPQRMPSSLRSFMLTGEETSSHWRRGQCLLLPDQGAEAFTPDCAGHGGHPLLLIWGDSYAAAEYVGLEHFRTEMGYDVAEYTSSACPPLIGFTLAERPFCKGNNDFVLERIRALRPEVVILHGTWLNPPPQIERTLPRTVALLREIGVKKIVVLGPPPSWDRGGLSANVLDYYFEYGWALIPPRSKYRLVLGDYDERMRRLAEKEGVQFISVQKVLCNADGCLTRIGPGDSQLTAFDGGHLTVPGSIFVMKAILPALLDGVR